MKGELSIFRTVRGCNTIYGVSTGVPRLILFSPLLLSFAMHPFHSQHPTLNFIYASTQRIFMFAPCKQIILPVFGRVIFEFSSSCLSNIANHQQRFKRTQSIFYYETVVLPSFCERVFIIFSRSSSLISSSSLSPFDRIIKILSIAALISDCASRFSAKVSLSFLFT